MEKLYWFIKSNFVCDTYWNGFEGFVVCIEKYGYNTLYKNIFKKSGVGLDFLNDKTFLDSLSVINDFSNVKKYDNYYAYACFDNKRDINNLSDDVILNNIKVLSPVIQSISPARFNNIKNDDLKLILNLKYNIKSAEQMSSDYASYIISANNDLTSSGTAFRKLLKNAPYIFNWDVLEKTGNEKILKYKPKDI